MFKKLIYVVFAGFSLTMAAQTTLNTTVISSRTVEDPTSVSLQTGFYASSLSSGMSFRAKIGSGGTIVGPVAGAPPEYMVPSGTSNDDQNWIKTTAFRAAGGKNPMVNITYFDGLGRPIQTVAHQQAGDGNDIVTHMAYDAFGRQVKEYLPFGTTSASVAFKGSAATDVLSFYNTVAYENTTNPFSEKSLEASPLNRVMEQAAPGNVWSLANATKHTIRLDYQSNINTEVKCFKATATWSATYELYTTTITTTGNYGANELYKTVTKDENWTSGDNNTTQEFKNKSGQMILKRTFNNGAHDTYYVYDQYGNLSYVIPPLAEGAIAQDVLDGLCYQYKYDGRNRLVEKKLPGKQWEFIVYDKLDRTVASGPAKSPFSNVTEDGWLVTKYDAFNRPVLTGWYQSIVNASQRKTLQASQNSATVLNESKTEATAVNGVAFSYTTVAWPTSGYHVLTVNYFDNYSFPHAETIPTTVEGEKVYYNTTLPPKGLPTGSWVRVLETNVLYKAETSITYYDEKARSIRIVSNNHLYGYTIADSKYDFMGKPLYTITKHKRASGAAEITVRDNFSYTAQDRLLTQTQKINSLSEQLIVKNTYDKLGQLTSKNVGGTDVTGSLGLQKVDYTYNIRGWLKGINDLTNLSQGSAPQDLFAFQINYNDNKITGLQPHESGVAQLFNGNISETFWRTAGDNKIRKYGYNYDNLNRLTGAVFQDPSANVVTNSFNESLTYDKNGNILTLGRTSLLASTPYNTPIDNLAYSYDTDNKNQLVKVADATGNTEGFKDGVNAGNDYTYDANGNMITDANKGITAITYNHLNLPAKITFGATGTIEYLYDAVGQKVEKKVIQGAVTTLTTYLNGYQYKDNVLQFFPQPEGYVNNAGGVYSYVFNYTDHLGNVRLSYTQDASSLKIMEENHYYPFGLKHKGYNGNNYQPEYKYKYNGKELQDELGLNMYDYGARNYDPALGRWMNIDPLAEASRRWSPYTYAYNNAVSFVDPDGMLAKSVIDDIWNKSGDGKTTWTFNGNGTASGSNGETADTGEETPPDEVTVGADGKVTKVKKDNRPNVFLNEDGETLDIHDADGLDSPLFSRKFKKGDVLFKKVSFKSMKNAMNKAGSIKYNKNANAFQRALFNLDYARASYYEYDFGHSYFKPLLGLSSETMGELYYGSGYVSGVPFIQFEGSNTLYNVPDAGNFMWGQRAYLNALPMNVMLNAAAKNEGGADTSADAQAMKAGHNYRTN